MISEKDKQAILNGAYGVSRSGLKCKFVGLVDTSDPYSHFFVYFNKKGIAIHETTTENLKENIHFDSDLDVIGLWEDEPEPFDLKKALAGEPVMTRDGSKAYIQALISQPKGLEHYSLIGFGYNGEHKEFLHWDETGKVTADDDTCDDIIGMWKEPEPISNTVTLTLPCPLKEPKDDMWFISFNGNAVKSHYQKDSHRTYTKDSFNAGFYFGSEADAQAWLDALKNNRR